MDRGALPGPRPSGLGSHWRREVLRTSLAAAIITVIGVVFSVILLTLMVADLAVLTVEARLAAGAGGPGS